MSTHELETTEGGTIQHTERKRQNARHSRPGEDRGRTCQGTEKRDRAWGTHFLEVAEGRSGQDKERDRGSDGHSLSRDGRRDLSRYGKKRSEQGALTSWRRQGEGLVSTRNESVRSRALTNWRRQKKDMSTRGKKPTRRGTLTA